MSKARLQYVCSACGSRHSKWAGQCSECQAWNTLDEQRTSLKAVSSGRRSYSGEESAVTALGSVDVNDTVRCGTGIGELDRVLGGGLVPGSVVLLGGDPGIGKSTLLLQLLATVQDRLTGIYTSGEESLQQLALRARRMGLEFGSLECMVETSVERILDAVTPRRPGLLIVDSIQTLHCEEVSSAPGSVTQLREATSALVRWAKSSGCAVILVGHVTKEGHLAGPRVLEHMVDAVLYFESDTGSRYRVIRAVKNRFGTVNELGVFAMGEQGLQQVRNPSAIFLSAHEQPVNGSVVTVVREGSRPLLVEIQALVDPSHLNNPRRVALGIDSGRLAMLLAVLHRHGGISLSDYDVFVNVVGGMRLSGTGSDLPVLLAALSSFRDRPFPSKTLCFGEVGLSGEVRPIHHGESRLREAAGHGFRRAIVPKGNAPKRPIDGLDVVAVRSVAEAVDAAGAG